MDSPLVSNSTGGLPDTVSRSTKQLLQGLSPSADADAEVVLFISVVKGKCFPVNEDLHHSECPFCLTELSTQPLP